jgi:hypothetical protein
MTPIVAPAIVVAVSFVLRNLRRFSSLQILPAQFSLLISGKPAACATPSAKLEKQTFNTRR